MFIPAFYHRLFMASISRYKREKLIVYFCKYFPRLQAFSVIRTDYRIYRQSSRHSHIVVASACAFLAFLLGTVCMWNTWSVISPGRHESNDMTMRTSLILFINYLLSQHNILKILQPCNIPGVSEKSTGQQIINIFGMVTHNNVY